jgi:hypothetical protein
MAGDKRIQYYDDTLPPKEPTFVSPPPPAAIGDQLDRKWWDGFYAGLDKHNNAATG